MPRHDPWEQISGSHHLGILSSRRVDATHRHELFWARNDTGAKALVLKWDDPIDLPASAPRIRGIAIDHRQGMLKLVLLDEAFLDIFQTLCEDLVESLRPIVGSKKALEALLARLQKWQWLLDKGASGLMSEAEIRGLYAELHFLDSELLSRFGTESVGLWTGPSGTPQDFMFGTCAIEVKSRSASGTPTVTISSADQLWAPASDLYLFVYSVGQEPNGGPGSSLRTLIDRVRDRVGFGVWRNQLEEKLLEVGYMDLPAYTETHYAISDPMTFKVRGNFPRITTPQLPDGVTSLSYRIHIEKCAPYSFQMNWNLLGEA